MNWLVTVSSENPAAPYLDWLRDGSVDGVAAWPGNSVPDSTGFDALLLAGGGDVAPCRYGAEAEPETASVNKERDEMEIELIRLFMEAGKPVFGICRGIQILNVALGGRLIQHLPRELSHIDPTENHQSSDGNAVFHRLHIACPGRMTLALRGVGIVNSFHHQAVRAEYLAPGLRAVFSSPSGIVEAIESSAPNCKLSAVQWHPERLPADHPASRDLLQFWVETTAQEAE